jgi:leucyl/phenylalanyl-tRNA--protein transferase
MRQLARLSPGDHFPPTDEALDYPNGLLAVGGGLTMERLVEAYSRGIFPWYDEPQPVLWWTPDPRSVLIPEEFHLARSLRRTLRRDAFRLALDSRFEAVMRECARLRGDGLGTWIGEDMVRAYCGLHRMGYARSIEVLDGNGSLVGGLYGVAMGRVFFGESMFSRVTDASKVAMVALLTIMRRGGYGLIDCQVESDHLNSLGARSISRLDFERRLAQTIGVEPEPGAWWLPATCGELL